MKSKRPISPSRLLMVFSVLLLVSLACNALATPQTSSQSTVVPVKTQPALTEETAAPASPVPSETDTPAAELPPINIPSDVHGPVFASYQESPVNLPSSFSGGYSLPVDLAGVKGLDAYPLTGSQKQVLSQNGFVVAASEPGKYREFYQIYESQRYELNPVFITTDSVFHVYHLIFDKMLRDLERESFIPTLQNLTSSMLKAAQDQYQAVKGTPLEEPALRNVAFFGVAAQLLGLTDAIPAEAKTLVQPELALIDGHQGPAISPIWDRSDLPEDKKLKEDYSQYIPRGHYTRSEELGRYFKAMMWYGRLTFRLRDSFETQRALLMVQALRSAKSKDGNTATQLWQNIYEPTVFIVGKADDPSFFEYGALSDAVFGAQPDLQAFADSARLEQFRQAAKQLPPPQVNSMWVWITEDKTEATQGFRFMGQRFTLDEYVFGQLIWRNVGTTEEPRGLPKGMDFFAALGSEEALSILKDAGETHYANYDQQMEKVRKEINTLQLDSWTQNLYWSWLYAFQPVIAPKDARYPAFMQNLAWTRKDLQTALGSWTELKHDTILYAKQVMAEMGGGQPETPPHGYVEPNPEAYARLLALAQMTLSGLESRGLSGVGNTAGNLQNLIDLLTFLKSAAERELVGQPLTDEEYWRIQYYGGELEAFTLAASDCDEPGQPGSCRNLQDQKAALVADVATGLDAQGQLSVLEEGSGQPTEIYVVLPDNPYRLAVGAVYTYYEFTVPPSERMTDEQWQAQVESGTNPPAPNWTESFISK